MHAMHMMCVCGGGGGWLLLPPLIAAGCSLYTRLLRHNPLPAATLPTASRHDTCISPPPPLHCPALQIVLVNPQIINLGKTTNLFEEGCLSFPSIYADVEASPGS